MNGDSKMNADEAGFKTNEMTLTAIVQSKSAKEIILETMEKEAFHYFIIFLVLIDLIILMVQQVLTLHHLEGYIHDEHGMEIGHEFLFILSCMVLSCFVIEIIIKIVLLREEFLGDILNIMDTFVIFFSLPFEIYLHLFNSAIAQISAPIIIVFRFYKVLRGIHHISESVEHKNRLIIQQITDEKMRAMARVNNYQSMIHELSKQVLEKEERAQEALAEQEVLLKQIKRASRRNRKRNNSNESLNITTGRSSTTPPGLSNINPGSIDLEKGSEKEEKESERSSVSSAKGEKFWKRRSRVLDIASIILPPTETPGDFIKGLSQEPSRSQRVSNEPSGGDTKIILFQPLVDEPQQMANLPSKVSLEAATAKSQAILPQPLVDEPEQNLQMRNATKDAHGTMTRKAYISDKKRLSTTLLVSPAEVKATSKSKSGHYISAEPIKPAPLKTKSLGHSSVLKERRRKSIQLRNIRVAQAANQANDEQHTLATGQHPHSPSSFFDSECEENPPLAPALSLNRRTAYKSTVKSEDRSAPSSNRVTPRSRRNTLNLTVDSHKGKRRSLTAASNPRQAVNRPSTTRKPMANPNSSREALGRALSIIPPPRPPPDATNYFHTAPSGAKFKVTRPTSQVIHPVVAFSTPPEFIISLSGSQPDLRPKTPT